MENESNLKSYAIYQIFGYILPSTFFFLFFLIDHDLCILFKGEDSDFYSTKIIEYFKSSNDSFWTMQIIIVILGLLTLYLLGHVIGSMASLFIERIFVRKYLKFPSDNLLAIEKRRLPIFENYLKPLSKEMQNTLKTRYQLIFQIDKGKKEFELDIFWMCNNYIIRKSKHANQRMHQWVFLYSLYRNSLAAILIYIIFKHIFVWFNDFHLPGISNFITISYLLICLAFFWNYLKLFKRNALDVYFYFIQISGEALGKSEFDKQFASPNNKACNS